MSENKKEKQLTPAEAAKKALEDHSANAPGEFVFEDQALLDLAKKATQNRGAFSYDPQTDAMYRRQADSFLRGGRQAMEDTVGLAQTMTGGYGNSYAQTAGQQAYNQQMEKLSEVMPQLYKLAYEKYAEETERLQKNYEALEDRKKDAEATHTALQKTHKSEQETLYDQYQDALARQDKEYTRLSALLKLGYNPTDEELAAAGMTRAMAQLIGRNYGTSNN